MGFSTGNYHSITCYITFIYDLALIVIWHGDVLCRIEKSILTAIRFHEIAAHTMKLPVVRIYRLEIGKSTPKVVSVHLNG